MELNSSHSQTICRSWHTPSIGLPPTLYNLCHAGQRPVLEPGACTLAECSRTCGRNTRKRPPRERESTFNVENAVPASPLTRTCLAPLRAPTDGTSPVVWGSSRFLARASRTPRAGGENVNVSVVPRLRYVLCRGRATQKGLRRRPFLKAAVS